MRNRRNPSLGEKMNRAMGLDPGFQLDRPQLVNAVRSDIESTVERAQRNLEQQRQNEADVERITHEMERERKQKAAAAKRAAEEDA